MIKRSELPCWLLATALISGCATTPKAPAPAPALRPAPSSAPVPADRPATIIGSEETSALLDNFTAYVAAVDGQPVPGGRNVWAAPLSLKPGRHRLTVEFNRGTFVARTELDLTARADSAYELKHASDAQVYGRHSYCEFWIVERRTGAAVTSVQRAAISHPGKAG